jgi:hypothetical protein
LYDDAMAHPVTEQVTSVSWLSKTRKNIHTPAVNQKKTKGGRRGKTKCWIATVQLLHPMGVRCWSETETWPEWMSDVDGGEVETSAREKSLSHQYRQ